MCQRTLDNLGIKKYGDNSNDTNLYFDDTDNADHEELKNCLPEPSINANFI